MTTIDWREQAKRAIVNGYKLIPLIYGQKTPLKSGWRTEHLSIDDIDSLPDCGFGILCGIGENPLYAFDLDVKDQKNAEEFISAFEGLHGKSVTRVGQVPEVLIPFRMKEDNLRQLKTHVSDKGHFDLLGNGQYFVAYNIHPNTKEEYIWSKPPHETEISSLALLNQEEREHLYKLAGDLFPEAPDKKTKEGKEWKYQGNRQYSNLEIRAFLACFGEEFYGGSHDEWIPVIMAVHHETYGNGIELACEWSMQGDTYDEANFTYKWDSFDFEEIGDTDKKRSTFASLFYKHKNLIPEGLFADRFTDAYNHALFSILSRGKFIYVESLGGWFVLDKHLWKSLNNDGKNMIGTIARFLLSCKNDGYSLKEWTKEEREEANEKAKEEGKKPPKSPREQFFAAYRSKNAEDRSKAKSSTKLLEDDSIFHTDAEKVDREDRYLGELDGILDCDTGKQIPLKDSPKLLITKSTGTPFVEGEPSQEFMDIVSGYFESEELMHFFTRCVGMALYGNNKSQVLINLLGVGGSGKSTLMKLLALAFGNQYITNMQATDIMSSNKNNPGGANPIIVKSFGSRVLIINETGDNIAINEEMVKQITGGDPITARLNYANNYAIKRASYTPFIISNKPLLIKSTDNSIWRRVVIIPFKKPIEKFDPKLESRLKGYAGEAKKWFLKGLKDYISRDYNLNIPDMCVKSVETERYELDTVQKWLDACCEIGSGFYEKSSRLADSYNFYLKDEEKSRLSVKTATLTKQLTQKGFETEVKNEGKGPARRKIRIIKGLKIRSGCEKEENNVAQINDWR
ncbi:MAG: DNA primase [Candidatus Liberibacter ctenarytainae]|uniref:DNA primase n=1 Tax=Candidatus Liberibacter ctenarytainae TaxID=2020335 RepID=A0A937AKR3_9HYPH|nr:DNA primase [Candidatus Liberibacter ctenarytainae]